MEGRTEDLAGLSEERRLPPFLLADALMVGWFARFPAGSVRVPREGKEADGWPAMAAEDRA